MLQKCVIALLCGLTTANTPAKETGLVVEPELKQASQLLRAALDEDSAATEQYPEYRRARCEKQGERAFFTLFRHITDNKIEMTAPVEMDYQIKDAKQPSATNMAFLYGSTQIGSPGKQAGDVDVADVPAQTVLSIGMRGDSSADQIELARRALNEWLKEYDALFESAGALRVMGYNSPFVPISRRYFEVQIRLRKKEGSGDGSSPTAQAHE